MAVTLRGRQERQERGMELARLAALSNQHRGEAGVYLHNPLWIFNPDPAHITHIWSNAEKVPRRKSQGWRVVTAEEAHTVFQVALDECDKAKNCAMRNGQILMVTTVDNAAGIKAGYILRAEAAIASDTEELAKAMGSMYRAVDHEKGLVESGKKRKFSAQTVSEAKAQRASKLAARIKVDMQRSTLVQPVPASLLEQDPDALTPHGVSVVDGVREVVLTDHPDVALDDFETLAF
jgi:hypothetical protein